MFLQFTINPIQIRVVVTNFNINYYRQKYKTFDNLIKTAMGHGKKNYTCNVIPSCSFAGSEFIIKSSLTKKQRYKL